VRLPWPSLVGWGLAGVLAAVCLRAVLADRLAGLVTVLPRPASTVTVPRITPTEVLAGAHRGIAVRLVDQLPTARLDVPLLSDRYVRSLLGLHWRRQKAPFVGPTGELGRLVQQVGLVRAHRLDADRPDHLGAKEIERRQTFGLEEGSIDQREAILAPAPATLGFSISLPKSSVLRFAPAVVGEGEVEFEVAFQSPHGRRVLWSTKLRGPSRRWRDVEVVLPEGEDATGELSLVTRCDQESPVLAFWGTPSIWAPKVSRLPYNIVWVVVDAMRPDAIASLHHPDTDGPIERAPIAPLDAWLPRMPEVAPNLDRLGDSGFVFDRAWSTAMWTRPATVAFLTGMRPARFGLPTLDLEVSPQVEQRFYARRPPLFALSFRSAGADTAAIVNNMYLCGYYGVGVDTGFERLIDHRYQAKDTGYILEDTKLFLDEHKDGRFALFVNLGAPHAPYVPPEDDLAPIERAPVRPGNKMVRRYLGEIHKDDGAIGQIAKKLEELGIWDQTVVVVTADHGETMSEAHDVIAVDVAGGVHSGRFTHLSTMWEEASRVPLLMHLPPGIAKANRSHGWVQTTDILPTLLELSGLAVPDGLDGRSLVPELRGESRPNRPVIVEGRAARSLMEGDYRLVMRDPEARRLRDAMGITEKAVELYNLAQDPGERRDIARSDPERVAAMQKRFEELRRSQVPCAGGETGYETLHLRFATAGRARHLEGVIEILGATGKDDQALLQVIPVGLLTAVVDGDGIRAKVDCQTSARRVVGFDLHVPKGLRVKWTFLLDGQPWPDERVFVGSMGLAWPGLGRGLVSDPSLGALLSSAMAHVVPEQELGLFVSRDEKGDDVDVSRSDQARAEARRAMQAWGYARRTDTQGPP
jgi:arylsulfatase A-like enzyme